MSVQSEMTAIANQVRRLSGETGALGISAMTTALAGVTAGGGSGVTIQRYEGTFTTDDNGNAEVDCGFQPDVVYLLGENGAGLYSQAIVFAEELRDGIPVTVMWASDGLIETHWTQTQTGFTTHIEYQDWSFNATYYSEKTISYVAIKYT